ncbi:Pr6Pr family membrane protein [Ammonicoccus fulvus]|uniref:Pr6Pr family membrane protein n=1 Tax=Ammonicoccus fulvus TaxID=3138240 RepID=A0ABZ3FND7_9ACTN
MQATRSPAPVGTATPVFHPARPWIRVVRIVVAVAILAALVTNTVEAVLGISDTTPIRLWSYFTLQSNLVLAVIFLIGAFVAQDRLPAWWDTARGGAAFYMTMTGIIYVVLIAPPEEFLSWSLSWTGIVQHRIGPWAAFLDWALVWMTAKAGWKRPLSWLVYPILFLIAAMVRGAITGWYPYHFLDPLQAGGWGGVATLTGVVVIAFLVMAVVMHLVGRLRTAVATRDRSPTPPRAG